MREVVMGNESCSINILKLLRQKCIIYLEKVFWMLAYDTLKSNTVIPAHNGFLPKKEKKIQVAAEGIS